MICCRKQMRCCPLGLDWQVEGNILPIANEDDLADDIWSSVAQMLWCQPIITLTTTEEESDSDAAPPRRHHKKPLKSGKLPMADSMVLKKVTLPFELVYMVMGQPAVYEDRSIH